MTNVLNNFPEVEIVALCDEYRDRVDSCIERVKEKCGMTPTGYTNHSQLFRNPNVNTVIISASWEAHVSLTVEAMRSGKVCGLEVGGGYSVEDCWSLNCTLYAYSFQTMSGFVGLLAG